MAQVIVVGGGLAGLSAAHTLLERGANVVLLDKQRLADVEPPFRGRGSHPITVLWVETLQRQRQELTALVQCRSNYLVFQIMQKSSSMTPRNPYVHE
jgi:2-polyprenyl-6-methoxyphenol hydroxylase-like FAD-dependent oxidoreductase